MVAFQCAFFERIGGYAFDFRAFYCAAGAVVRHHDPYLADSLRGCEATVAPSAFFAGHPRIVVPAPLPGYAIAAFVPLALLPFQVAAAIWIGVLGVAWFLCAAITARVSRAPPMATVALFAFSIGLSSLPLGQLAPVGIAAICCTAAFLRNRNAWGAGFSAAVAMLEPHLGVPACLALALWAPKTRPALLIAGAVAVAASYLALGPAANVEYVTRVLDAHALAEARRDTQLSLTSVLTALGVVDGAAVRDGSLWYLAMLAAGCLAAGRMRALTRDPAHLAFVPVAFAVFGGPFVHVTQVAAALPCAVLVAMRSADPRRRAAAVSAALLLAVPWVGPLTPAFAIVPVFPIAVAARSLLRHGRAAALCALGSAALPAALFVTATTPAVPRPAAAAPAVDPRLAEATWSTFSAASSTGAAATWLGRIPTWAGLLILLATVGVECRVAAFLPPAVASVPPRGQREAL